jgi:hypothetical protein
MNIMKTETIREILGAQSYELTKYKGVYTYRRGFFYRLGMNQVKVCEKVEKNLKDAGISYTIIDCGEQWTPFRGGSSLKDSSHWFVKFTVNE